jgi:hypothetical protein
MPLLDDQLLREQRGMQKTGDIRTGVKVPDKSPNGFHPAALSTFRFTSLSEYAIQRVGAQLGGKPADWIDEDRARGYQVTTDADVIAVLVPPNQVIDQWYEMWRRKTLVHRCDSQTQVVPAGKPCECPHAEDPADVDEVLRCALLRAEMAKRGDACARVTRLFVQIPSLPDIGVWRLTTGGIYAAGYLAKKAEILRTAREAGAILPALLRLDPQERAARPGEAGRKYVVPKLELLNSVQEILAGAVPASLPAAMDMLIERAPNVIALETAPSARRAALTTGPATPPPSADADDPPLPDAPAGDDDDDPYAERWERAAAIYRAALATNTPEGLRAQFAKAEHLQLGDEWVKTDEENDAGEPLRDALRELWRERARGVA